MPVPRTSSSSSLPFIAPDPAAVAGDLRAWSAQGPFPQPLDVDTSVVELLRTLLGDPLDRALDELYRHIGADPSLLALFGGPDRIARARRGQVRYWQVMLLQPFGHAHLQMARSVAHAHYRVGLEPGTYVQSYRFLLNALTTSLLTTVPAGDPRLPTAVLTLQRLILEDIELVIRLYHRCDREKIDVERGRYEMLLGRILPANVVERLASDATVADTVPLCTVLFADLVGFTRLAARQRPEETVRMLDAIFARFDAATESHGLEKIKTIGDAYMAAGGFTGDAHAAVGLAAQLGLEFVDVVADEATTQGLPLQVRVGVHCGPVVAGVVGKKRFLYDLWGDTVNVASRMESSGVAGRVQLSEAAAERLPADVERTPRDDVHVKGVGDVRTWLLVPRAV